MSLGGAFGAAAAADPGARLRRAAQDGDVAAMEELLDGGADVESRDGDGTTPLMSAVFGRQARAVEFLLARGADANAARDGGETVLHLAARTGDEGILRALFAAGAAQSIDRQTHKFLQTPLHIAALTQEEASMRALLEAGAQTGLANREGRDALGIAVGAMPGNETGPIRLLVEEGHADTRAASGANGMTALHFAVLLGKLAAVKELVRLGADPEQGDAAGYNALHFAAEGGWTDVAAYLVSTGMNPGAGNDAGQTPRAIALLRKDAKMAAQLLQAETHYVIKNKNHKFQPFAPK